MDPIRQKMKMPKFIKEEKKELTEKEYADMPSYWVNLSLDALKRLLQDKTESCGKLKKELSKVGITDTKNIPEDMHDIKKIVLAFDEHISMLKDLIQQKSLRRKKGSSNTASTQKARRLEDSSQADSIVSSTTISTQSGAAEMTKEVFQNNLTDNSEFQGQTSASVGTTSTHTLLRRLTEKKPVDLKIAEAVLKGRFGKIGRNYGAIPHVIKQDLPLGPLDVINETPLLEWALMYLYDPPTFAKMEGERRKHYSQSAQQTQEGNKMSFQHLTYGIGPYDHSSKGFDCSQALFMERLPIGSMISFCKLDKLLHRVFDMLSSTFTKTAEAFGIASKHSEETSAVKKKL
eukprot:GHVT01104903.1.p1 GENE.GHVT01104903.1~~GHVT01104903.1.p1  ORF type:complete len:357 (-),score=42.36 GHVT01104903.1:441-1478(-)